MGALAALACALSPAGAGAAQQIGMTMFPSVTSEAMNCLDGVADPNQYDTATLIQYQRQTGSSPSYTVPANGVITSWAHMPPGPVGWAESIALRVFRPQGGTQFKVIGQSAEQAIVQDPVSGDPVYSSYPVNPGIKVQAGDVIGLSLAHAGNVAYCREAVRPENEGDKTREIPGTGDPGTVVVGTPSDTLNFTTTSPSNEQPGRLSLAVTLEPDADNDGLGDETQEAVPFGSFARQLGMTMHPTMRIEPLGVPPAPDPPDTMNCLKEDVPQFNTATLIQYKRQTGSTPTYTVPANGVITSWAHTAPLFNWVNQAALQVFRPAGGDSFNVIGQSALEEITGDLVGAVYNSFPTRIPVQANDVLGLSVEHLGNIGYCQELADLNNAGDKTREIVGTGNSAAGLPCTPFNGNQPLDFGTAAAVASERTARLSLAVTIEPDANNDGYGDLTQAHHPADGRGPCVPASSAGGGAGGAPIPPAAALAAVPRKKCKKGRKLRRGKCVKKKKKK